MSTHETEFLKSLRATFRIEADEHLQGMLACLLELEKATAPDQQRRIIETAFRSAHSLKGAARAVNFTEIETICQSLEDVLAAWRKQDGAPPVSGLDALHGALDDIGRFMATPKEQRRTEGLGYLSSKARVLKQLAASGLPLPEERPLPARTLSGEPGQPPPPNGSESVRITVAKLDKQLLEAEEMLSAKLTASQRASDLCALEEGFTEWRKEEVKIQPDLRAVRQSLERPATHPAANPAPPALSRLVEFFEWNHDYLRSMESKVATLGRAAAQDRLVVGKLVDDLLENSKKLLMLPLATLGTTFPKMVRDLCRDQGKEADLVIRGEEVEIDKRILEEMKDPLIHIFRNCIDHGIEGPEERRRQGKPVRATITLTMAPLNVSRVELLVSDDGAGIEVEKVKEAAVERGVISKEEADRLDESEALELIFIASVSTNPLITRLSGRGLGLAIVREKTEKLGGWVSVECRRGEGTTIRITLPSALATLRGILVKTNGRLFVVPTTQVESVARFHSEDVRSVGGRETLKLNGRAVALVRLAEVLELPGAERSDNPAAATPVVVLGAGDHRVAFAVDAVLDEQEVLVKRLGKPLVRVRNIAGSTVLGTGQVAPVLNVSDLLKSARNGSHSRASAIAKEHPEEAHARKILVVEDSITSRMFLKGILEAAGYKVKTTVDGMEAHTVLRTEHFDLVVSDVEMPRLNGFDLTARIRADKKLAELPVVLVTALESNEDRERGVDAGANAYLVKSSFDQANLIEAIRRLL